MWGKKNTKLLGWILTCCLLIVFSTLSYSQKLIYKIEYSNDSIGFMTVERKYVDSKVIYDMETRSSFSFMFRFRHHATYKALFENNILTSAMSEHSLNGKERSSTEVSYQNGQYTIRKGDDITLHGEPITESVASLYFSEPKNNLVFSERYGEFCSIKRLDNRKYELLKPNDRANIYHFKNGICDRVEIDMPLATLYLVRIK